MLKTLLVIAIPRLSKIAQLLFPVLVVITFSAIIFDIYKYLGFFKKHFFLDSLTLFNILIFVGLIVSVLSAKKFMSKVNYLEKIFNRINIVLLPISVLSYIYFNGLLSTKGINYVFSKYHIQPQNIPLLIFFSAFILFVYLYKQIPDKTV